mmetsp:Transcript_14801/g.35248  ORF Transcript_14801/g.35248 Transcript_14801/m.35248 type:complete len:257 (-) Transcript_14801:240-1010(-)|eukprot:CAMPEP_0184389726 /NCGR_PEP_ID=MMETSP0007-20130409/12741_1 /TAXON_ID=97485 /ORGANISM="Prymnesium parvum, Strain Texoma1" /LENGTH=256 /DNA_ID=CAMNT_0026739191 /DNA_START=24 /DNA_END=794 /DNA_ORIENTATION=+
MHNARRAHAPGGNSTFVFDDGWKANMREPSKRPLNLARGPDVHLIRELEGEAVHRHTNGLRRQPIESAGPPPPPEMFRAPPTLHAPMAHAPMAGRQPYGHAPVSFEQHDSLSDFVNDQQSGHAEKRSGVHGAPQAVPPGGFSSFSFGWGDDGMNNHHMDYHRRHMPLARPVQPDSASYGANGRNGVVGIDQCGHGVSGYGRANSDYAHGGSSFGCGASKPVGVDVWPHTGSSNVVAVRSSTRVCAPPGGVSTLVFG